MRLWTFKELLTPAYWRYRKATRLLDHARRYALKQGEFDAVLILLEVRWRVEDEYYGRTSTKV